jgi:translation initiation factor IF-2
MSTIRVHELAKELNISSKDVIEKLNAIGVEVKNHLSAVNIEDAVKIRQTSGKSSALKDLPSTDLSAKGVNDEGDARKRLSEESRTPQKTADPWKKVQDLPRKGILRVPACDRRAR